MKRKRLEMYLERVSDVPNPIVSLEQYSTPADIASQLIHWAHLRGDIDRADVYDLGCGNGILAIGAGLLGAKKVVGFDCDMQSLKVARENCRILGVDAALVCSDIEDVNGKVDTVVMNPPFGAQKQLRHIDRSFLQKGLQVANVIYTIHNKGSESFIRRFINRECTLEKHILNFPIKKRFSFHNNMVKVFEVEVYRIGVS